MFLGCSRLAGHILVARRRAPMRADVQGFHIPAETANSAADLGRQQKLTEAQRDIGWATVALGANCRTGWTGMFVRIPDVLTHGGRHLHNYT